MTDTVRMGLTLLEAAQAQKHVTLNEALVRLDALASGRVEGLGRTEPPAAVDGQLWGVGPGATGAWAGEDGRMALATGGGWVFADPWEGWRIWDAGSGGVRVYLGGAWRPDPAPLAGSAGGAATLAEVLEIDHQPAAGTASVTPALIPDKAVVLGVTARVLTDLGTGSWALGVAGEPARYGSGFGMAAGSFAEGVTGQPLAYYGGTGLSLTASGGSFSGAGTVRLAVHLLRIAPPAAA